MYALQWNPLLSHPFVPERIRLISGNDLKAILPFFKQIQAILNSFFFVIVAVFAVFATLTGLAGIVVVFIP